MKGNLFMTNALLSKMSKGEESPFVRIGACSWRFAFSTSILSSNLHVWTKHFGGIAKINVKINKHFFFNSFENDISKAVPDLKSAQ